MIKFREIEIKEGDKLKVTICEGVEKVGTVVFDDAAYCLEYFSCGVNRKTALTNYAHYCKFEKL